MALTVNEIEIIDDGRSLIDSGHAKNLLSLDFEDFMRSKGRFYCKEKSTASPFFRGMAFAHDSPREHDRQSLVDSERIFR
ncbi:MAG: hypothetical protein DWI24_08285 [Planctomycetota bacterium]|nr:MAG: hypothetical protein DWI24_08285 [Planctomycetota bacterium]